MAQPGSIGSKLEELGVSREYIQWFCEKFYDSLGYADPKKCFDETIRRVEEIDPKELEEYDDPDLALLPPDHICGGFDARGYLSVVECLEHISERDLEDEFDDYEDFE